MMAKTFSRVARSRARAVRKLVCVENMETKNVDYIKRSKKKYRNKKRQRKEGERGKCRKKKYRTFKNVENVEDNVNRQFAAVLYSTGVECCLMMFFVSVRCTT